MEKSTTDKIVIIPGKLEVSREKITSMKGKEGFGKTMIACNIAARELKNGGNVLYITRDNSVTQVYSRIISAYAYCDDGTEIPYKDILKGTVKKENKEKLNVIMELIRSKLCVREFTEVESLRGDIIANNKRYGHSYIILDSVDEAKEEETGKVIDSLNKEFNLGFLLTGYGTISKHISQDDNVIKMILTRHEGEDESDIKVKVDYVRRIGGKNHVATIDTNFSLATFSLSNRKRN